MLSFLENVVFDGVCYAERPLALYVAHRLALSEGYAVHHVARLAVYKLELDVLLIAAHHLACAVVVDVAGAEQRLVVVGPVRSELL